MSKDIESVLANWPITDKPVTARVITGDDGQPQLQLRLDCGVLQMYLDGRPDGAKPHNCQTYMEYLERRLEWSEDESVELDELVEKPHKVWAELDREMTQYYHRRLALLGVARDAHDESDRDQAAAYYERAVRDADHTLRAMDFIVEHCEDEDHVETHERFRPFVLWHRTVARTQLRVLDEDFDEAVELVKDGMSDIAKVYEEQGLAKWLRHDPSIADLKEMEEELREKHGIRSTLNEQLAKAVADENFEQAAKLRDMLKARGRFQVPPFPTSRQGMPKV